MTDLPLLDVAVTTTEPVMIGAGPTGGNVVGALGWVPGWVLRGALAAAWIRANGPPTEAGAEQRASFEALFEGVVRFGTLLAAESSFEPMSVVRCKYRPEADCHGWALDLADTADHPTDPTNQTCPHCSGPVQEGKGNLVGLDLVARTHTALTADETPADGQLFTREAIPAGTTLRGRIVGTHPWLIEQDQSDLWLGGRRTVGGRATVTIRPTTAPGPQPRADGRVVLRAMAPLVAVDNATAPVTSLAHPAITTQVAGLLGVPPGSVAVDGDQVWDRTTRVDGWHAASGLPKPAELAIASGATVVLRVDAPLTSEGLSRLAVSGIGLRRNEGLGQIEVNPPPWRPPAILADESTPTQDLTEEVTALLRGIDESLPAHRARVHRFVTETLRDWSLRAAAGQPVGTSQLAGLRVWNDASVRLRRALNSVHRFSSEDLADLALLLRVTEGSGERR